MDKYDEVALIASLNNEICQLSHGPYDKLTRKATNCIINPIGQKTNKEHGDATIDKEFCIPICNECAIALSEDDWTLLFCLNCLNNVWVLREISKLSYRHHIIWLGSCPKCSNEFGGIYFNEE